MHQSSVESACSIFSLGGFEVESGWNFQHPKEQRCLHLPTMIHALLQLVTQTESVFRKKVPTRLQPFTKRVIIMQKFVEKKFLLTKVIYFGT